jgi:hypothetical protein
MFVVPNGIAEPLLERASEQNFCRVVCLPSASPNRVGLVEDHGDPLLLRERRQGNLKSLEEIRRDTLLSGCAGHVPSSFVSEVWRPNHVKEIAWLDSRIWTKDMEFRGAESDPMLQVMDIRSFAVLQARSDLGDQYVTVFKVRVAL